MRALTWCFFFFCKVLVLEDLLLFGLSDELAASAAQACLNPKS